MVVTDSNDTKPSTITESKIDPVKTNDSEKGSGDAPSSSSPDESKSQEEGKDDLGIQQESLTPRLDQIKDILEGRSPWGKFLEDNQEFEDVLTAVRLVYKYHPNNDGSVYPIVPVDDTHQMREDLRHLSALGVRLAVLGALYESSVEALDQERRLARSRAWSRIRRYKRRNNPTERITNDMLDHEANASVANFYNLQSDVTMAGKILSWVRVSIRDFNNSLRVMIQTQVAEERRDAALNS
jgi:hypothetical protein